MYERNAAIAHDTEDRNWWYLHGVNLEEAFVRICNQHLSIRAMINPDKRFNKYAPDLKVDGNLADLKTQNTPFFTARKYGLDPQYTLTFNRKDYERYKSQYPTIDIYVWLDWRQTEGFGAKVNYLGGIFRLPFSEVARLIEAGAKEHHYLRRQDPNDRNAKSSFLLDIREFEELFRADDAFIAVAPYAKSQSGNVKKMRVADIVVPF
jgi:hypothetical protein